MKELITIQSGLKCPKNQRNNFGGYNYRNCEDIMEAVKPLLKETGCTLTVTDEVLLIGTRFYVKATATLRNSAGESETTTAFAREEETKKGMDASQITGASSSYARKYALNGLFCIDDVKDSDTTNTGESKAAPKPAAAAPKPAFKPAAGSLAEQKMEEAIAKVQAMTSADDIHAFYAAAPAAWRQKDTKFYKVCEAKLNQLKSN